MKYKYINTILTLVLFNTIALAADLPEDAKRIIEARKKAIENIDKKFVEELERIKTTYTKRGDLDTAIAIDQLIKSVSLPQFTLLEGNWIRDFDGRMFKFDSQGGGIFSGNEVFKVTYNRDKQHYELNRDGWKTNIIKINEDKDILTGVTGSGRPCKLTRVK